MSQEKAEVKMLYRLANGNPIRGRVHGNKKRDSSYAVPLFMFRTSLSGVICLHNLDVLCLPALGTLGHIELNALAFLKRTETVRLDGGVVNEYILTIFPAKKSKTLGIIKPLDCSLFHNVLLLCTELPSECNVEVCVQAVTRTGKNFRSNSTIGLSVARKQNCPTNIVTFVRIPPSSAFCWVLPGIGANCRVF
jgi:hypothetical protein